MLSRESKNCLNQIVLALDFGSLSLFYNLIVYMSVEYQIEVSVNS